MKLLKPLTTLLVGSTVATTWLSEKFDDGNKWTERWVQSKHKDDYGKFELSAGAVFADESDVGLKTSQDAKFYAMSRKFDEFTNADKNIVVQFSVKHAQKIDCGGGYVKLFPASFSPEALHGESEYNLMFGPDICGFGTKKVHVIFSYNGKNHLINKEIKCKDDELTHVYTLHLQKDNSYEVYIDGESAQKGSLGDDWDMLLPKQIKDPDAKKPEDWVNEAKIDDPEDVKPEGYDDIAEFIADPEAEQPEDWDEEMDGEWEAPMISNPEFKGEWKATKIDNPAYKGEWVHPMIDNPEYVDDKELYSYKSWGAVGLDLWQVKAGSVFDNFLIGDDLEAAIKEAKDVVSANHEGESAMLKAIKDEKDAAEDAAHGEMGDEEEAEIAGDDDYEGADYSEEDYGEAADDFDEEHDEL